MQCVTRIISHPLHGELWNLLLSSPISIETFILWSFPYKIIKILIQIYFIYVFAHFLTLL